MSASERVKKARKIYGKNRLAIYDIIRKKGTISLEELRNTTSINYNSIKSAVIGLTKAGKIKRVKDGVYEDNERQK